MFRIVAVILLLILTVCGCQDTKKDKKAEEKREQERNWKVTRNTSEEDILLLSIKYELSQQRLEGIITEYEKMVFGISTRGLLKGLDEGERIEPISHQEITDVNTSLNTISEKYGISKKVLATLIIELRMMGYRSP